MPSRQIGQNHHLQNRQSSVDKGSRMEAPCMINTSYESGISRKLAKSAFISLTIFAASSLRWLCSASPLQHLVLYICILRYRSWTHKPVPLKFCSASAAFARTSVGRLAGPAPKYAISSLLTMFALCYVVLGEITMQYKVQIESPRNAPPKPCRSLWGGGQVA